MKKILFFICALVAFIAPINAIEFNMHSSFTTEAWWQKNYRFLDYPVKIIDRRDTTWGKDPHPHNKFNFFGKGIFEFNVKSDKFNAVVKFLGYKGVDNSFFEINKEYGLKYHNYVLLLTNWYFDFHINDYLSIICGKKSALTNLSKSNQNYYQENELSNMGCLLTGSAPSIQLSLHSPDLKWEFKCAVLRTDTSLMKYNNFSLSDLSTDTLLYFGEVHVPKIEGSFAFNHEFGMFGINFKIAGGFQKIKMKGVTSKDVMAEKGVFSYDVKSGVVGTNIELKLGKFKIIPHAFFGENIGLYGCPTGDPYRDWFSGFATKVYRPVHSDDDLKNSKVYGEALVVKFKPINSLQIEIGGGTVQGDHEFDNYEEKFYTPYAFYTNVCYKIHDMLEIIPEVGYFYYGPDFDYGKYTYWGIQTYIEF